MDTKKIVRVKDNVIDFHADAKEMLKNPKEAKNTGRNKGEMKRTEVVRGIAQPSRKIDFLNDQLGSAKSELTISRQNHNALVDQIIFAQKDFKRRLRTASEERRATEEKYSKVSAAYSVKEKEAEVSAKKVSDLKEKFNKLHTAYSEKIEKFKEQHKSRIEGKETLAEKKMKILLIEKEKTQKSVNYLMDAVYQRSEKIAVYEKELKSFRTEKFDLVQVNENLKTFKEDNQHAVSTLEGEVGVLKSELESSIVSLKEREKELDQLTFKLNSTTEEFNAATQRAEEFQQKFFGMQNEVEVKRSKIQAYDQTIADLRTKEQEGDRLADEVRDFQIREASLQGEIHALKEREDQYKASISNQTRTLDDYKDKLAKLEYSLNTLQTEFDDSNRRFNEQIKHLEDKNTDLGKRESKLLAGIEQIQVTVADKDNTIVDQRRQAAELRVQLKSETSLKTTHEKEVFELKSVRKTHEEDIQGLKRNIAGLKIGMDDKVNEIQALNTKLDSLEGLNEKYTNECVSLEEHISEVSAELRSTKEQGAASMTTINSLNEKIFSISGELLDTKEEKENLELQISDLNAKSESEKSKYQILEDELAEKVEALSEAKDREADFLEAKLEWEDDSEVLELRIKDFVKSVEEKDQEIIQKQDKIEEYLKQFRDLNAELDHAKKDVTELETERLTLVKSKESLVSKNEQLAYKKSQLETFVKDGEAKVTKLNNQVNDLEKKVFTGDQIIVSLEKKLAESGGVYASEKKTMREEIDSLVQKQQESRFVKKDTEVEIANTHTVLDKTRQDLTQAKNEIQSYKDQIKEMENNISIAADGEQGAAATIKKKDIEISKLMTSLTAEQEVSRSFKDEIFKKTEEIKELKSLNKGKEVSVAAHRDLQQKLEILSTKESNFEDELSERREELGLYSRWVDSQKESLKNHIVRFTQELKLSLTINPLHSYLAMTEKELSKVELLLAKPGILGEQRNHLEGHHKILMEQKRYIGQMVERTKADVEKRVTEVVGLLKQGDFIPVPPLPPQKKP